MIDDNALTQKQRQAIEKIKPEMKNLRESALQYYISLKKGFDAEPYNPLEKEVIPVYFYSSWLAKEYSKQPTSRYKLKYAMLKLQCLLRDHDEFPNWLKTQNINPYHIHNKVLKKAIDEFSKE